MESLILECAVRAALVAMGTAVVLWAMRVRPAAVRHAAWTAVVVAMLLLPIWLAGGPRVSLRILQPTPVAAGIAAASPEAVLLDGAAWPARDTAPPTAPLSPEVARPMEWQNILFGTYLLGVVMLLTRLLIGTIQANKLRRNAVMDVGRLTSRRCATPITVGWFRPALILPSGWQHWPAAKLAAVLTHEREHARRHDPLVQWLALLNRAVFWFHPLSWWLERRLATLAEEACDAAVIAAGHSPQDYSDYLLDLARSMTREGRRLNVVGMAMPGSGLTERMRRIFEGLPLTPVSRARVVCTLVLCAGSSVMFAAGTLAPRSGVSNILQSSSAKPRFEVASIKPCDDPAAGLGRPGGRGAGAPSPPDSAASASPGRVYFHCATVEVLIMRAYFGEVFVNPVFLRGYIMNGPAWMKSDRYDVEAKGEGAADDPVMRAQMIQGLLEDRFKLKLHRETRDAPVYALTTAKRGVKVSRLPEGACEAERVSTPPVRAAFQCGTSSSSYVGPNLTIAAHGMTAGAFAETLGAFAGLDHPVIDKTGLTGLFDFHVEFARDAASADPAALRSIFSALQEQLGLKLDAVKSPTEFLVIDHVEPPTPDTNVGAQVPALAQAAAVPAPTFDAASIKPCVDNSGPAPGERPRSGGPGSASSSPGYVSLNCLTLSQLVNMASGKANDSINYLLRYRSDAGFKPVRGGPSWVDSDRFTIEAKSSTVTDQDTLRGPMLRVLLEDRFQLRTHRATEDRAVYALKVAAGGLKIQPIAPGSCFEVDPKLSPQQVVEQLRGQVPCGTVRSLAPFKVVGAKIGTPDALGTSLADRLSPIMDRVVIDQTGLDGRRYDVAFDYTPDDTTPNWRSSFERAGYGPAQPPPSSGPNIFKALELLGLKLEPTKWPVEYLVIDRAERPRPN